MSKNKNERHRTWCVTINNPSKDDIESFEDLDTHYQCYNIEIGEKGTPHIQGYLSFKNAKYFNSLSKALPRAHLEPARGSAEQNKAYCGKQGRIFEKGIMPIVGKQPTTTKTKQQAVSTIESLSMTNDQIRQTWPTMSKCLIENRNKLNESKRPKFNPNKRVVYITGPSGSGKTKLAHEMCGEDCDKINYRGGFLNGYSNENKNIIWDEFRPYDCNLTDFLLLTDKYSNRVNVKGGDVMFYTDLLVITSIKHPHTLYPQDDEDTRTQIMRRIEVIDLNEH